MPADTLSPKQLLVFEAAILAAEKGEANEADRLFALALSPGELADLIPEDVEGGEGDAPATFPGG